jgi:hypothetical protein
MSKPFRSTLKTNAAVATPLLVQGLEQPVKKRGPAGPYFTRQQHESLLTLIRRYVSQFDARSVRGGTGDAGIDVVRILVQSEARFMHVSTSAFGDDCLRLPKCATSNEKTQQSVSRGFWPSELEHNKYEKV